MAAVADDNYGYLGEVTSAQTPIVLGRGARYAVGGPGDLRVIPGGTGDRAVTALGGNAWGDGVLSIWDGDANLNLAAASGSPRWDTVVARREWTPENAPSGPTGTTELIVLPGGTSRAVSVERTTDAGVTTSDQPVALVRATPGSDTITAADVVDLRVWAGHGGGLVAGSVEALQYIDGVGTQVRVGRLLYTRVLDGSHSPVWAVDDLTKLDLVHSPGGESAFLYREGGHRVGVGSDNTLQYRAGEGGNPLVRFDTSGVMTHGTVPGARVSGRVTGSVAAHAAHWGDPLGTDTVSYIADSFSATISANLVKGSNHSGSSRSEVTIVAANLLPSAARPSGRRQIHADAPFTTRRYIAWIEPTGQVIVQVDPTSGPLNSGHILRITGTWTR